MYHASSLIPISRSKFCQERWIWGWSFWNEVPSTMPTESACPAQKGMGISNVDFHMFFDTIVYLITFSNRVKQFFLRSCHLLVWYNASLFSYSCDRSCWRVQETTKPPDTSQPIGIFANMFPSWESQLGNHSFLTNQMLFTVKQFGCARYQQIIYFLK